jgi:hypothetical protein
VKDRLQERLSECLEALSSGQRTLDECLAMYPEEASRLEPLLRTALRISRVLSVEPRPEFAAGARQRFLSATGQHLAEAFRVEPRPSFVKAARERFLAAAQRVVGAGKARRWPLPLPRWGMGVPLRPVAASALAFCLIFVGFGTFAVTTSGDAIPGDWRYPVKRATENVRLTFAFSEGARRDLNIDLAEERLWEIERLADEGRPIGGDLLGDLEGETNSLVGRLDESTWETEEVREVTELVRRQQKVLAEVEPLVKADAQDDLEGARTTSQQAYVKAAQAYALALWEQKESEDEEVEEMAAAATEPPTAGETEAPPTMMALADEESEELEEPSPPPSLGPEVTPVPGRVVRASLDDQAAGVAWDRIVIDRFSVEVPAEGSGWHLMGFTFGADNTAPAPYMLRIANLDTTAIIVINPRNGDIFWYEFIDGLFQEFIVRIGLGDGVWQAEPAAIQAFDPEHADIVLHMLESVTIAPPPTPTPLPTETPTPLPQETATVAAGGVKPDVTETVTPAP